VHFRYDIGYTLSIAFMAFDMSLGAAPPRKAVEAVMARVLISMDDSFLDRVDEFAHREHRSRSELIREALRTYMRRNTPPPTVRMQQEATALEAMLNDDEDPQPV
jgi:CopG family transcriptional regulator / antitoxin EndoAI